MRRNPISVSGIAEEDTYGWTLEVFRICTPVAEDYCVSLAVEFLNIASPHQRAYLASSRKSVQRT